MFLATALAALAVTAGTAAGGGGGIFDAGDTEAAGAPLGFWCVFEPSRRDALDRLDVRDAAFPPLKLCLTLIFLPTPRRATILRSP